jgi:hypothetical protein
VSTTKPAEPHPGYVGAADVVRIHGVTLAYVYKMANRDHWRRYTLDGHVRYHRGDVDDSLGRNPSTTGETSGKIPT